MEHGNCDEYVPEQDLYYSDNVEVFDKNAWVVGAVLFFLICLGPVLTISLRLPRIRIEDLFILIFFFSRWMKSSYLRERFFFSPNFRILIIPVSLIAFTTLFSTMLSISIGKISFVANIIYTPIMLIRMILISAIFFSLTYDERNCKRIMWAIVIVGFFTVSIGILQKYIPDVMSGITRRLYGTDWERIESAYNEGSISRIGGAFGNPNLYSCGIVAISAMLFGIIIQAKGLLRLLALMTLFMSIVVILLLTGSRTALLTFAIVMIFGVLISFRRKAYLPVFIFLILLLVAYFYVKANLDHLGVNPRLKEIITGEKVLAESFWDRFYFWRQALTEIQTSPIWGIGVVKDESFFVDNGYIIMMYKAGIIGLIAYITMLGGLFRKGFRLLFSQLLPYQRGLLIGTVLVLVNHIFFEIAADMFWSPRYGALFSALIGILCGLSKCQERCSEYNYVDPVSY